GLTRLVDKRRVRRDRADVFCTTSEGVRGKRAVEWGLVDELAAKSKFADAVKARAEALASAAPVSPKGPGIALDPVVPSIGEDGTLRYRHVTLELAEDARTAVLRVKAPSEPQPKDAVEIQKAGAAHWPLRAFRELDDALLRLRVNHPRIGVVVVRTEGSAEAVLEVDRALHDNREHWLANEILRLQARVLRRMDLTSKSFFALIEKDTCFAG